MAKDIPNSTVAVFLVLVILFSAASTVVFLDRLSAKQQELKFQVNPQGEVNLVIEPSLSQYDKIIEGSGKVGISIL